jgi:hypothetical protein
MIELASERFFHDCILFVTRYRCLLEKRRTREINSILRQLFFWNGSHAISIIKIEVKQFLFLSTSKSKAAIPSIFQNFPLESPLLVHLRHISNFIIFIQHSKLRCSSQIWRTLLFFDFQSLSLLHLYISISIDFL